ncbi:hypothetical protein [Sphaerisporangium perillae]|uniref:hypothetical protein n=1 Tax=Sphaerisporangium perillae TaxID=2935860 RepID=UPI0020107020|nr:hypothetical protein [Sphaerisporangium perillae]
MTLTTSPLLSTPPASTPERRAVRVRWILVAGWLAHLLLRLWLARWRTGPVANPDESTYLVVARWLAGGPGMDMSGSTFYQGGYPLLLAPVFWLVKDPEVAYRMAVGIGAAVGAALFPLGYAALRRLAPVAPAAACALAFAATLLPATLVFGQMALTDAILPTLLLGWLLALHAFAGSGRLPAGLLASALAGYGFAVHLRGTVVLLVHVVILAVLLPRGLVPRRAGLVAVAAALVTAAGGYALNAAVRAAIYPAGPRDLSALLWERLTSADGQAWALSGAAGQVWYLVVGTWGLAGAGLAAAAVTVARRATPVPARVAALALLLVTAGIAYASSAALPDEHRVGNYAYGRYLTCVAVVLALLGLAALTRASRRAAVRYALASAVLMTVTGGVAALYAGDRLRRYAFIAFDFPEISFLTGSRTALDMTAATISALGLLACLLAVSLPRTRLPLAAGALAAVNALFIVGGTFDGPASPAAPDHLLAAGDVAVDRGLPWPVRLPLMYRIWWTEPRLFDPAREPVPPGVCAVIVSPAAGGPPEASWPGHPAGWRPASHSGWVSWSPPACAAAVHPRP